MLHVYSYSIPPFNNRAEQKYLLIKEGSQKKCAKAPALLVSQKFVRPKISLAIAIAI